MVFYCVRNKKLKEWLADDSLMGQLGDLQSQSYVDYDTVFRPVTDKDYDLALGGVTRSSFCQSYHEWLVCCNMHRPENEVNLFCLRNCIQTLDRTEYVGNKKVNNLKVVKTHFE